MNNIRPHIKLSPNQGGCWFCELKYDVETDLMFDTEFDTYFHMSCLQDALQKIVDGKMNPEAIIMAEFFAKVPDVSADFKELFYKAKEKFDQWNHDWDEFYESE